MFSLFSHRKGKIPQAGAEQFAFGVNLHFAPIGLFGGDNGRVFGQLRIEQPPPLYTHFANTFNGLGGLQAGGLYSLPLSPNPSSGQNSGSI